MGGMTQVLVPTTYLPPIEFFVRTAGKEIVIDLHEHFIKQTYRNRCTVLGPNGVLSLSVPLVKRKDHTPVKDIRISYEENWQQLHWRTFESAYRRSPYFEYYEQDLRKFYENKTELLWEFNLELLRTIYRLIKIEPVITFAKSYDKTPAIEDLRPQMTPKVNSGIKNYAEYTQVFSDRFGFVPDLSVVDALFNLGPRFEQCLPR